MTKTTQIKPDGNSSDTYTSLADACSAAEVFEPGDHVEGGAPGTADYDTGRVVETHGDQVTVAWDSQVTTTQHVSLIRSR